MSIPCKAHKTTKFIFLKYFAIDYTYEIKLADYLGYNYTHNACVYVHIAIIQLYKGYHHTCTIQKP